ncbi:MAG: hypothetical protein R3B60_03370 [Candidatus Paceibacterota bacterium]
MKKFFVIFLIIVVAVITYYKFTYPTFTYKYRMTVEVETPEGIKSGSSVIEVRTEQWPEWISGLSGGNTENSYVTGESVFVDLGDEKNIVVLLAAGSYAQIENAIVYLAPQAFLNVGFPESSSGLKSIWASRLSKMTSEKIEVRPELVPTMVSFQDLDDPKSVQLIYAADRYEVVNKQGWREYPRKVVINDFNTKFGDGYELKGVWLELTDDPITKGLEEKLLWWNNSGRPASEMLESLRDGHNTGTSIEPERIFIK